MRCTGLPTKGPSRLTRCVTTPSPASRLLQEIVRSRNSALFVGAGLLAKGGREIGAMFEGAFASKPAPTGQCESWETHPP